MNGSIFQNFNKFKPKSKTILEKSGDFAQNFA